MAELRPLDMLGILALLALVCLLAVSGTAAPGYPQEHQVRATAAPTDEELAAAAVMDAAVATAPHVPAAGVVSTSPECCPGGGALSQARWPGDYPVRLSGGGTQAARPEPRVVEIAQTVAPVSMKHMASAPDVPDVDWKAILQLLRDLCEYVPGLPSTGRNDQERRER